jgi:polysaccharide transporter, PST family
VSDRKRLIENIGSLAVLNGSTYLLPLVTFPYLVRVLGPEKFGLIAFAQGFVQIFVVLTNYGFDITATQKISVYRDEPREISKIFNAVMGARLSLLLLSFAVMATIVLLLPRFRSDWAIYMIAFLFVVGDVLFPVWFFQGMERMKYITVLAITGKIVATFAIFAFVREQADYLLAAGFQMGGMVLTGLLGLGVAHRIVPILPNMPSLRDVVTVLQDGWEVFLARASVGVITSGVFIVGLFHGSLMAGYYAIAEKIIKAAVGVSGPITIATFPVVSKLFVKSRDAALAFLRKTLLYGGIGLSAVSVGFFFGSSIVVRLVTGDDNDAISVLIKIMAIIPLTNFIDNIYGTQVLLPLGRKRQFLAVILSGSAVYLVTCLLLTPTFAAVGAAIAVTIAQVLVSALMAVCAYRTGVKLHRKAS